MKIHVGLESIEKEELYVFDLLENIHTELQGFEVKGLFTALNRLSETQDINHDNVIVWSIDYESLLSDDSAHRSKKMSAIQLTDVNIITDTTTESTKPFLRHL